MTKVPDPNYGVELKALADRLNRCERGTRYDTSAEKQAAKLAYDFLDLAESFQTFLKEQLPKLRDESLSCAELDDVLTDIGEEFRHTLWHIHNAEFYAYLREDVPVASPKGDEAQ
jgi:hypothetical protein